MADHLDADGQPARALQQRHRNRGYAQKRPQSVKYVLSGEIQTLVDSFNKMGEDLMETTVSKDYVDDILKNMLDSLIVINPDGTIKTVNRATCNLLGYKEEELVGENFSLVIIDKAEPGHEESLDSLAE